MKKNPITKLLSLAFLVACLVGVMALSACSSNEPAAPEEEVPEDPEYSVQLFIDCEKNLIFSRYDVDVMVDGELVGNVEHGSEATFELSLKKGQHELVLEQEEASEPDGRTSFVVEGEGDKFAYRIGCTADQIEIESIKEEADDRSNDEEKTEEESDEQVAAKNETTKEDDSSKEEAATDEDKSNKEDKSDKQAESSKKNEANSTPNKETKPSKYEYAYVRRLQDYDIYYLIDFDDMAVTYFSTNDAGSMVLPISGTLKSGIMIDYGDYGFQEHIRLKTPGSDKVIIVTDGSGFDWEYMKTDASEAETVLASIS